MKEYRIFISSTFKDMQQERDIIRNEVFPELEVFAAKQNIAISIVDLRWGINTEECESSDESSFKIFRTCFDEIDESRPFFVGLVGNRYGWIPNLDELPLSLDSKFKDFLKFKGKSITESEMLYAIDTFENDGLFVFAFRDDIKGEMSEKDKGIYLSTSKEDKAKIDDLKKRLKNNKIISYFDYETNINNGVLDLKEFSSNLTKLIIEKISLTIKEDEHKNEIDKILEEQNSAIELNHSIFSGRENVFENLKNFYESEDKFIAIAGESGTGKSAFIQEEIYRQKQRKDIYTLSFLLGTGEGSKDVRYSLAALLYQVKQLNKHKFDEKYLDINFVDKDYESLVNNLSMELTQLSKKKPVYIYLDALDQLIDNGRGLLSYLNTRYFELENINIKIIVTFIPRPYILDELKLKLFRVMDIPPLNENDIVSITKRRLAREKKSLSSSGIQEIINKKSSGVMCASSPLYLSLLLQQIVNLDYLDFAKIEELKQIKNDEEAIYSYIQSMIKDAPLDLKGEMFNIIDSVSKKINKEFVYYALGIISMSRYGVRENDLYGIFKILNLHYESTDFSYLRKMFRHFLSSHSSYIDYNHKIIDDILEDFYFVQNKKDSIRVSLKTLEYLDSLDDDDEFKRNEYFYYAHKAESKELFYERLKETDYLVPFYNLFEQEENSNNVSDFFLELTRIEDDTIAKLIDGSDNLNYLGRRRLILLLLENKNISELNRIKCLHHLAKDERNFGNSVSSDHISKVLIKESLKHDLYLDESFTLRAKILLDRNKFRELSKLIKKVQGRINETLIKKYDDRLKALTKPRKVTGAYLTKEELMEKLNNLSLVDIYAERESVERNISKHIASYEEIVSLLKDKENKNRDNSLNAGVKDAVAYSYILYLIGIIYLAVKDKEQAKAYLAKGYSVIDSLFELLEEKKDYTLAGEFAIRLKRLNKVSLKDLYSKQISMFRHKINDVSYNEMKSRKFALAAVFMGIFLVIFVFDLFINSFVYLISFYSDVEADLMIMSYIEYSTETIVFIGLFFFVYFLLSFIFDNNHFTKKALIDLLLIALSASIVIISSMTYKSLFGKMSYFKKELLFLFANSCVGSIAITLVAYAIKNFNKKEITLSDKADHAIISKKQIVQSLILYAAAIGFSIWSSFHFDDQGSFQEGALTHNVGVAASYISIIGPLAVAAVGIVLYTVSLFTLRRKINEK